MTVSIWVQDGLSKQTINSWFVQVFCEQRLCHTVSFCFDFTCCKISNQNAGNEGIFNDLSNSCFSRMLSRLLAQNRNFGRLQENDCLMFLTHSLFTDSLLVLLPLQHNHHSQNAYSIQESMVWIHPILALKVPLKCCNRFRFMQSWHTECLFWPGCYFVIKTTVAVAGSQNMRWAIS
jgi:hypothetical protein